MRNCVVNTAAAWHQHTDWGEPPTNAATAIQHLAASLLAALNTPCPPRCKQGLQSNAYEGCHAASCCWAQRKWPSHHLDADSTGMPRCGPSSRPFQEAACYPAPRLLQEGCNRHMHGRALPPRQHSEEGCHAATCPATHQQRIHWCCQDPSSLRTQMHINTLLMAARVLIATSCDRPYCCTRERGRHGR
jgi:hypothetical protein